MDPDACQIVIDEDSEFCDYSMERYLDMKGLKAKLVKEVKTEGSTETYLSHHFVPMQKQLQTFMIDQVEQTKKHEAYEHCVSNDAIRQRGPMDRPKGYQHHKIVRHDAG